MKYFLLFVISFSLACSSSNKSEKGNSTKVNEKEALFRKFIKKFDLIGLPFKLRLHENIDISKMEEIAVNSSEFVFLDGNNSHFLYGILPDTSNYYATILFIPADAMVPMLYVYSKKGELISKETLVAKGCALDCGVYKCTVDCFIGDNNEILLIDTNGYYVCDDKGNELKESHHYFSLVKKGRIDSSGKIYMEELKEIDLRENK